MQVADEHASSRRTRLSYLHPVNNTNKQYMNPYTLSQRDIIFKGISHPEVAFEATNGTSFPQFEGLKTLCDSCSIQNCIMGCLSASFVCYTLKPDPIGPI